MKKNRFTFLFIVLIFNACCKQLDCLDFTEKEKAWIPYSNVDTLVFKNFNNDSVISFLAFYNQGYYYTRDRGILKCNNGCFAEAKVRIINVGHLCFDFNLAKYKDSTHIAANDCSFIGKSEKRLCFDLNRSLHHDSIKIAGSWMRDVYEYARIDTPPTFKNVYVKNGTGIVKFTLIDNQSFELLKVYKK